MTQASRQSSPIVRVTRGAQALSLVALLYLFIFEARSPAEFFTLLSLVVTDGAATSVHYAQRRDASGLVLVLAALIGAALTLVIVYGLLLVSLVFFGEG